MEVPQPPRDSSLRNIIDKLAEFVARNGPEFETITKAKQQGNPKFEFLYGGEFYNYYQYRVASEQVFLKQQHVPPPMIHQPQHQQPTLNHHNPPPPQGQWNPMNPQLQQQPQQQQQSSPLTQQQQSQYQQQPQWQNNHPTANNGASNSQTNLTAQIEAINVQQNTLREQILQSEQNLSAQHGVLMQQQQKQIDDAITQAQNETIERLADEQNVLLAEFDGILQPIIESCTKDSISAGKNWILQHTSDTAKSNVVLQYLLKKALLNGSTFTQKLHLIYLVNDVLHHCVRKNCNDLKSCLENVVIPMFCSAEIIATDEQKSKLAKLLSLWESKAKFFDACVISKLQSPKSSMQEYKTNLMNVHNSIVAQFTQATKTALENYKQQHQIFIQHATQQIAVLETQKQTLEAEVLAKVLPNASLISTLLDSQQLQNIQQAAHFNNINSGTGIISTATSSNNQMQPANAVQQQQANNKPLPLMAHKIQKPDEFLQSMNSPIQGHMIPLDESIAPVALKIPYSSLGNDNMTNSPFQQSPAAHPQFQQNLHQQQQLNLNATLGDYSGGGGSGSSEYTSPPPNFFIPDLSKPPPGFLDGPPPIEEANILTPVKPEAPYYDLPAGLMVPLIRLEDYTYKPLDPNDVSLPPPAPVSERLSSAIVAFYAPPSHDRPRDVEGWEKLGLYEYYKVKNAARKQKEEEIKSGLREKSRSPTPIEVEIVKPKNNKKRLYRSKSRSRSRSRSKSPRRSKSRSPPPQRSRSPVLVERNRRERVSNANKQRSPKPLSRRDRDRGERDRGQRLDRERDHQISTTPPPSFFGGNYPKANEFIEETNKGHQMLKKMGWGGSGTGLGSKGQGIDEPISGGEVRDKRDMYKGVGININDPFENFRKNKGAAFIHRMRSRTDEKS